MSIPGVFQPHHLYTKQKALDRTIRTLFFQDEYYVDGGVFLSYPLEIFDYQEYQSGKGDPHFPIYNPETLGFALVDNENNSQGVFDRLLTKLKNKLLTQDENLINLVIDLLNYYYQNRRFPVLLKEKTLMSYVPFLLIVQEHRLWILE